MRYNNRQAIQDAIPLNYKTESGIEFALKAVDVGGREDPAVDVPHITLTWSNTSPDPSNAFHDMYLNMVRTIEVTDGINEPYNGYLILTSKASSIAFDITPNTSYMQYIDLKITEVGKGCVVNVSLEEKLNEEWVTLKKVTKNDYSIDTSDYTQFPLSTVLRRNGEFRIVIKVTKPADENVYIKVAAYNAVPLYRIGGKTGTRERWGRIELINLDFDLTVGDLGLFGGTKVPSENVAWTVYKTIFAKAYKEWDKILIGGCITRISGLRRTGGMMEETSFNFTIEFRFEHGMISQEPRYPIEQINLRKIYLTTQE